MADCIEIPGYSQPVSWSVINSVRYQAKYDPFYFANLEAALKMHDALVWDFLGTEAHKIAGDDPDLELALSRLGAQVWAMAKLKYQTATTEELSLIGSVGRESKAAPLK